jgi:hypothetical protein
VCGFRGAPLTGAEANPTVAAIADQREIRHPKRMQHAPSVSQRKSLGKGQSGHEPEGIQLQIK